MSLLLAARVAIVLQVVLLIVWGYDAFMRPGHVDAAGRGLATVYILALAVYIVAGVAFLLIGRNWSLIVVLVMAMLPLGVMAVGLWKEYER